MEKEALLMKDEAAPSGSLVEKRSARTYLLMKFDDSVNLTEMYRRFHLMDHVSDCAATRGDYDLILILQADNFETINEIVENKIMTVEGLNEAALMPVESPATMGKLPDRARGKKEDDRGHGKSASSYVLLEMEKDKLESVCPSLPMNGRIVFWDCTKGKFDIVMRVQGASFTEIDHMIRNQIGPLAGVLRIKELPIIQLMET
jgi:hypothetical protein